jgi:copper chaperone CopZ
MPTQKLHVSAMSAADEQVITTALAKLDGVIFSVASHADRCVEVEFEDDCVTIQEVVGALAAHGFSATPVG